MDNSENILSPEEKELAEALGSLKPAANSALNRDTLMFKAGKASSRKRYRFWQATSICMLAILAISAFIRATPKTNETERQQYIAAKEAFEQLTRQIQDNTEYAGEIPKLNTENIPNAESLKKVIDAVFDARIETETKEPLR